MLKDSNCKTNRQPKLSGLFVYSSSSYYYYYYNYLAIVIYAIYSA